ncbi:hypothetical protein RI53_05040 [Listeria monocytogenes]|nr:hypothetical protein [Listeria monocytogenes]EHE4681323.1 AAA family ATPase [Listeria monocytogenes]EHT7320887.1 AAA family ATPase [Listeria monocytogenes]
MLNYFIEKITIRGSERKDAVIELQKGLNIISGPSNTGKTSIVKAIDFLYGTDKADAPFSISATGYNQVEMVINTKDGRYSLKRKFDENKIYVYLLDSENTHQLYGEYNARTGNSVISQFWLNLIGISDPQQIIKNKDFIKQNLSWRTFSSSTLIQQSKIDSETSVLLPDVHSSQTAFLSALLFLFDGDQFSDTEENETDEQRKIRRKSVINYINTSLSDLYENYETAKGKLPDDHTNNLHQIMTDMIAQLASVEQQINSTLIESKTVFKDIYQNEQKLNESSLLKNRYKKLYSQYKSDIERLSLIVDGERLIKGHTHDKYYDCPFCNGKLPESEEENYIEAARAELSTLIAQLTDLSEAIQETDEEINDFEEIIEALYEQKDKIDAFGNEELKPKAQDLKLRIKDIEEYLNINQQLASLESMQAKLRSDLQAIENETNADKPIYKPKDKFKTGFYEEMSQLLDDMLRSMNYKPTEFRNAFFAKEIFDVKINGDLKSQGNGQGYTSFVNSVVVMAYRHVLSKYAQYKPSVFIIDTPLLGLDERQRQPEDESMKENLFKYFIEHQDEGQLIIIENTSNLPNLDYESFGVNEIKFTEDKDKGRYGYLYDIYN